MHASIINRVLLLVVFKEEDGRNVERGGGGRMRCCHAKINRPVRHESSRRLSTAAWDVIFLPSVNSSLSRKG